MSEKRPHRARQRPGRLPLPQHSSPPELDERVLAYARERAPHRTGPTRGGWMAGLATAGIVGIAVLLVQLQGPPPPADGLPQATAERRAAAPGTVRDDKKQHAMERTPRPAVDNRAEALAGGDEPEAAADAGAATAEPPPAHPATKALESYFVDEIGRSVDTCLELRARGDEQAAEECYTLVRRACPACDFPATLEEAAQAKPEAGTRK